jgi:hypothetical protein
MTNGQARFSMIVGNRWVFVLTAYNVEPPQDILLKRNLVFTRILTFPSHLLYNFNSNVHL